ncbi:methyltransferase domain-containing protein [Actinokineospora sp. 24-640]
MSGFHDHSRNTLWGRMGAAAYEPVLARGERRGMRARRAALLAGATGRVLEIGAGTGLNVEHYGPGATAVVLTEPAPAMHARLERAALAHPGRFSAVRAAADDLPVDSASVDTVVSTMVLCTVPDVPAALSEVVRVLKPGGRLLFIEHVRAALGTPLARWQGRLAGPWATLALGCRCDRDLFGLIGAYLTVEAVRTHEWTGMPFVVRPLVVGSATAP